MLNSNRCSLGCSLRWQTDARIDNKNSHQSLTYHSLWHVKQLLAVAKIPNGTGQSLANATVTPLEESCLAEKVVGLLFDTTASNIGQKNKACILIEGKI